MWHQVTLRHWRLIRKQVLSDPLSREVGHTQWLFLTRWNWCLQGHPPIDLKVTSKLQVQTAHAFPAPAPSLLLFPPLTPVTSCEAPGDKSNEGK